MMTETQREKFSKILDLNHEVNQESNPVKKWDLAMQLNAAKADLKSDMGAAEYDAFMDAGTRMFAPKR